MLRDVLLQYMDENIATGVQFLLALLATLLLFGLTVWMLRLLTGGRKRQVTILQDDRLQVLDRQQVDENRSLLLVRRDGVEHLLMVGGPSDVVVESHINLKDGREEPGTKETVPGHEIARRVIAQRPLRTVALNVSAPDVAESLGLLSPVKNQLNDPDPADANIDTQPNAQAALTSSPVQHDAQYPITATPTKASDATPQTRRDEKPVDPIPAAAPAKRHPDQADADVNQSRGAARLDLPEFTFDLDTAGPTETTAADTNEPRANTTRRSVVANEEDLAAGLATALAMDDPIAAASPLPDDREQSSTATRADRPGSAETQTDINLESQFADMMEAELMDNASSYNGNNTVVSHSESAPSRAERSDEFDDQDVKIVDTTRPGRVDDEMSRLLKELASPGRV